MISIRRRIVIATFLLIILLCVFINTKMKEGLYETKVRVISYENQEDNENKQKLEKILKHYDYDYEFVGQGESWKGFGNKFKKYQEYITNTDLNDEDILIIIDSRDVYVNRNSDEIASTFKQFYNKNVGDLDNNLKIVFSTERACCTPGVEDSEKTEMKKIAIDVDTNNMKDNDKYYLNAGMCMGYVKAFKQNFLKIDMDYHDDDQTEITHYWMKNNDIILLDYNETFFSNAHGFGNEDNLNGCPYVKKNKQFVIKDTDIRPFFIQTPAKYWTCYNYLYKDE